MFLNPIKYRLILVFLFLISCNFLLSNVDTVYNISDTGTGSLRRVIDSSFNGDTIVFSPSLIATGSSTINLLSSISIKHNITIIGLYNSTDTVFISGGFRTVFNVDTVSKVIFDSIVINNCGSGIKSLLSDSLFLKNSIIRNSFYNAVSCNSNTSLYIKIQNTKFNNNTEAIYLDARNSLNIEIDSSRFLNNQYNGLTAVSIFSPVQVLIKNSDFINTGNSISVNSVNSNSKLSLINCNILDCKGGTTITALNGKVEVDLNSTIIRRNDYGLHLGSELSTTINIDSSLILNNKSVGVASYVGYSNTSAPSFSSINVSNSSINDNISRSQGGGIQCQTNNSLSNISIFNSEINNNSSLGNGGGIYSKATNSISTIFLENSKINNNDNNYLTTSFKGGGIFISADKSLLSSLNCQIDSNFSNEEGGGIYMISQNDSLIVNLNNTSINSNISKLSGGGLYLESDDFIKINVNKTKINNNSILDSVFGVTGGLHGKAKKVYLSIDSSEISNNHGGGLMMYHLTPLYDTSSCKMMISNSTFNNNFSYRNGGGIWAQFTKLKLNIDNSSIENNSSKLPGGGIYSYCHYDTIIINQSTISHNNGTGIYAWGDFLITEIKNSTISHNNGGGLAGISGAAAYSVAELNVVNCTFFKNYDPNRINFYGHGIHWYLGPNNGFANITSSILALNGIKDIGFYRGSTAIPLTSSGNNIFSNNTVLGSVSTDQLGVDSINLKLGNLTFNGGSTKTLAPLFGSVAINLGNIVDSSDAQNRPIIGRRDIGAAEYNCNVIQYDTIYSCSPITWNGSLLVSSGDYQIKYIRYPLCDSINKTHFIIDTNNSIAKISCEPFFWYGKQYDSSGVFYQPLSSASLCGTTDTLFFTRKFSSLSSLNINTCKTYLSPSGRTLSSSGIYSDTILNFAGCDSVITINFNITNINTNVSKLLGVNLLSNETSGSYQWLDCNNSFSIITGETNRTFNTSVNGSYAVEIIKNSCIDTSTCVLINSVSLSEEEINKTVIVFPNPTLGLLNIKSEFEGNYSLFSMDGKKVLESGRLKNQLTFIDISNLSKGMYILLIDSDDGNRITKRIVKQ